MITVFSIPKPFLGAIGVSQRNAIKSWSILHPDCEVILFANEEGTAQAARELDVRHIPEIEKNEYGTPILTEAFKTTLKLAKNNLVMYINADIILMSDFIQTIKQISLPLFLLNGRRQDIDLGREIDFSGDWQKELTALVKEKGILHGYSGIDYFVFPKKFPLELPKFAVGRPGWDNWFIWNTKKKKIPIIDATSQITAVHQNHPSIYKNKISENKRNFDLAGGFSSMCTLRDADWVLRENGLTRPDLSRRILSSLALFYPWRKLLAAKRAIGNR
jgi:hypothetical protein